MRARQLELSLQETKVHDRIFVVLSSKENVERLLGPRASEFHMVDQSNDYMELCAISVLKNSLFSLEATFKFNALMEKFSSNCTSSQSVLVCTGYEPCHQAKVLFLLGCHLVISRGLRFEETLIAFRPFWELFGCCSPGVNWIENCWLAICCVKRLKWIDFSDDESDRNDDWACEAELQMDEYMHYAR